MDDNTYIQKVIEGDADSFRYLIDRYKGKAFSVAFSVLRNQSFVEDVVQDAFIKAYQNINTFRGDSKFSTWLMRIVVNESIKVLRKQKLERQHINETDTINESELNNSLKAIKESEQKKYIDKALNNLPHRESTILQLYYLNEHSVNEIEEILELKADHIKVLLFRARKQFYTLLQNELKHELKSLV